LDTRAFVAWSPAAQAIPCPSHSTFSTHADEFSLLQLGVKESKARQRLIGAISHTSERTTDASEREQLYQDRLKNQLQQTGERMQDELRAMVELVMADGTDHFLQDFNDGALATALLHPLGRTSSVEASSTSSESFV